MANAALQSHPRDIQIDAGISRADPDTVANELATALADNFSLRLKTTGLHWNVAAANFLGLHRQTGTQYQNQGGAAAIAC